MTARKAWDRRWLETALGRESGIHNRPLCASGVHLYGSTNVGGQRVLTGSIYNEISTQETPYHTGNYQKSGPLSGVHSR